MLGAASNGTRTVIVEQERRGIVERYERPIDIFRIVVFANKRSADIGRHEIGRAAADDKMRRIQGIGFESDRNGGLIEEGDGFAGRAGKSNADLRTRRDRGTSGKLLGFDIRYVEDPREPLVPIEVAQQQKAVVATEKVPQAGLTAERKHRGVERLRANESIRIRVRPDADRTRHLRGGYFPTVFSDLRCAHDDQQWLDQSNQIFANVDIALLHQVEADIWPQSHRPQRAGRPIDGFAKIDVEFQAARFERQRIGGADCDKRRVGNRNLEPRLDMRADIVFPENSEIARVHEIAVKVRGHDRNGVGRRPGCIDASL